MVTRPGGHVKPDERERRIFFLAGSGIPLTIKPGSGTPSGVNITYMVPMGYVPFFLQAGRVSGGRAGIGCEVHTARILVLIMGTRVCPIPEWGVVATCEVFRLTYTTGLKPFPDAYVGCTRPRLGMFQILPLSRLLCDWLRQIGRVRSNERCLMCTFSARYHDRQRISE